MFIVKLNCQQHSHNDTFIHNAKRAYPDVPSDKKTSDFMNLSFLALDISIFIDESDQLR